MQPSLLPEVQCSRSCTAYNRSRIYSLPPLDSFYNTFPCSLITKTIKLHKSTTNDHRLKIRGFTSKLVALDTSYPWRAITTHKMFLAFIFVFIGSLVNAQQGTVQLSPTATVTGEACCSTGTAPGFVYYGVRYGNAQRFQHSTENEDYSFLLNATRPKFGPVCPQTGPEVDGKVMSEDCLYLDIYVPPIPAGTSPQLPVLMFIYGGGLQGGTKDTFNASSLVADINAIVVMMNYRVGALGFLSTGDEAAKGNYGLGDCKVAVKWIQKHISKFGGDPNALTVFGESAGAGLTSALILGREKSIRSSLRAVALLSGSILIDIAYNREPKKSAVEVAQKAGCPTGSSLELVNCLKQLPLDDLLRHSAYDGVSPTLPYAFVVDGEHIPDVPIRSLQAGAGSATRAPHVLTGYLREDTSFLLQGIEPELNDPSKPVTMDQLRNIVARRYLPTKEGGLAQCQTPDPAVINRILQRYNITSTTNRDDTIWKFFHLATDSQFGHQAVRESLLYANGTGTSQLYRIDYDPGMGLGAFHTLEIMHMFSPIVQLNLTFDERLVKSFRDMLRQLAYNGKMDGPNFSATSQYLQMNQAGEWLTVDGTDLRDMLRFWEDVAQNPCATSSSLATQVVSSFVFLTTCVISMLKMVSWL